MWHAKQRYQSAERKAKREAVVCDEQGAWIATTGDMHHARLIAATPELREEVRALRQLHGAYSRELGRRTHALEVALSERKELRAALETLYDWVEGNVAYGTPRKIALKVDAALAETKSARKR